MNKSIDIKLCIYGDWYCEPLTARYGNYFASAVSLKKKKSFLDSKTLNPFVYKCYIWSLGIFGSGLASTILVLAWCDHPYLLNYHNCSTEERFLVTVKPCINRRHHILVHFSVIVVCFKCCFSKMLWSFSKYPS